MNRLNTYLKSCDYLIVDKAASEDEIDVLEKELNGVFSKEFRMYLNEFGRVTIVGHELTGASESERLNVVSVTRAAQLFNGMTDDMYVVEDTAYDGLIIWQSSNGEIFETINKSEPRKIADSLYDYLVTTSDDSNNN